MPRRKKNETSETTAKTESSENAPGGKPKRVYCDERYVTQVEFQVAIQALQERLDAIQKGQLGKAKGLELAPRPPVHHKRKVGRRYKLASTIDGALYDKIRELEAEGYQLGHLIDSAFRVLFGRPKLSFEAGLPTDEEVST